MAFLVQMAMSAKQLTNVFSDRFREICHIFGFWVSWWRHQQPVDVVIIWETRGSDIIVISEKKCGDKS